MDDLDERTMSLCLRSVGGSFSEALKISELLYSRAISTVITYGSECYSACAIIFMSGTMHDRIAPYRKLSAGGVLGFHAPYLSLSNDSYSKDQLDAATQGMRLAILELLKLSSRQTQLAGNTFWKMSLVTGILERGPKEVEFVRTIADAARWNILIFDAEKYFPSSNSMDEIKNVCANYHYGNMDAIVPSDLNLSVNIERYSSRFHKDDFRVLVTDNKTHSKICEIYPRTMEGSRDRIDFFVCSYDYWSDKSFGDCREYKTAAIFGKYAPHFFTLDPNLLLKSFTGANRP